MKRGIAPVIIVVVVLVGLLYGLGVWQSKSASPSDSDSDQQASQQQNTQKSSDTSQPADPADKPVANLKGVLVTSLVSMQTIGDPKTAKTKVTIGYSFDTQTQAHPEKAAAIVDAVKDWTTKQGSSASLQIVCLDLPSDQLTGPNAPYANIPMGVSINGSQPDGFHANPGEGTYTADTVLKALDGAKG